MVWMPFEEIAEGKIVEALYAADLWAVYTDRAAEKIHRPQHVLRKNLLHLVA